MNFNLTEEQNMVRQAIRELAEKEIAPRAAEFNRNHEFPWPNFKLLAENGYLNMHLPEPYGGGMDWVSYAIVIEELARRAPSPPSSSRSTARFTPRRSSISAARSRSRSTCPS